MTCWADVYETKPVEKNYYFKKLFAHFVAVNGTNRFTLIRSSHAIIIKDGATIKFKCPRNESCVRNLYLELYAFKYDCELFLEHRNTLGIVDYKNSATPPDSLTAR